MGFDGHDILNRKNLATETSIFGKPTITNFLKGGGKVIGGVIAFFVLLAVAIFSPSWYATPPPAGGLAEIPKDGPAEAAQTMAFDLVKKQLKAPATADFVPPVNIVAIKANTWDISGAVDSENTFGGKLRTTWAITLTAIPNCADYYRYDCWQTAGPTFK